MTDLSVALKEVFSRKNYAASAVVIFAGTLLLAIWLPNLQLIGGIITSPTLTLTQKISLLIASLGAIRTNFTPLARFLTTVVAFLFGVNFSMLIYYLRQRLVLEKSLGTGFGGILTGLIGIGCASCGSVILSSLFGVGTTVGFIGILPLKGQEFGILSIAILTFSIYAVAQKIKNPTLCGIDYGRDENH